MQRGRKGKQAPFIVFSRIQDKTREETTRNEAFDQIPKRRHDVDEEAMLKQIRVRETRELPPERERERERNEGPRGHALATAGSQACKSSELTNK